MDRFRPRFAVESAVTVRQTKAPGFKKLANPMGGFSAQELLITLAIVAIIAALAVPSMRSMIANARMTTEYEQFKILLELAQSHAGRVRKNVTFCASNDLLSCNGGSNWAGGAIVCETDQCGRQVHRVKEASSAIKVLSQGFTSRVEFLRTGDLLIGGATRASFLFCDDRGAKFAKVLILSASGRTSPGMDADHNNIVENHLGVNVSCP